MKRIIFAVNTVMTLMSSIYYATKVKRWDSDIETTLIWQNPTQHKILLKDFDNCFDKVYEIPQAITIWGILSLKTIQNEILCKEYLLNTGIKKYIKKRYEKDILMVGADYNGILGNLISLYYKKYTSRKIILFEEGMALYSDKKRSLKDIIKYNIGQDVDTQPTVGASRKVGVIFAQHPEQIPKWKCKKKKLIRQSDIFADTEIWSNILNKDKYLNGLSEKLKNKKVLLYLGQPIQEFSRTFRMKEEIELIEKVLKIIPKDYIILIKPHPRDPINKYRELKEKEGCIVFDKVAGWYPIECLLQLFDTKTVMTFSSSAALNILDRIENCKVIYTYQYFKAEIANNWNTIYQSYGSRVSIPKDFTKMKEDIFKYPSETKKRLRKNRQVDLRYIKKYLEI